MQYNTDGFAGYQRLKEAQKKQLDLFERWASQNHWLEFDTSNSDWWMFPIGQPSNSYGSLWTVYDGDVIELKKDQAYVKNYLHGAELLALSWGWDLHNAEYVKNPHPDQRWQDRPLRLYKLTRSLREFGFKKESESIRTLALDLIQKGANMKYHGKDFSFYFQ